jgi:tetratricopeptide (TPR) repeat protein
VQNFDQAEAHLKYAIDFKRQNWHPDNFGWDPYLRLAEIYKDLKQYEEASRVLQDAIRHFPLYNIYSRHLAEIYCLNQQYKKGLNLVERIDWSDPNITDISPFLRLAEWGLENNHNLEAVASIATNCDELYMKRKLNDTFLLSRINLLIGWSLYFTSNLAEAIKRAEQAEKFLPDHPYTLSLKALVLEKYARFSQSKEEREEYINWSLDYWRDLYLSTEDHVFKERAENTLKYYRKID